MKLEIHCEEPFSAHGENTDETYDSCPFCGSREIEISNTHTPSYRGECFACGAVGPSNPYPEKEPSEAVHRAAFEEALRLWNARS
jgi:uncharacterized Zn finger protein